MRTPSTRRAALGVHKIGRVGLASLAPAVGALLLASGMGDAQAKTPGKTYCFYGKCHRVKTVAETQALIGKEEVLMASHYDSCKRDRYNPCGLTSSGERFNSEAADNAASPIYPDGTTLLVWSPDTKVSIVLRVNNAGPYWGNRRLDVSRRAAEKLGFAKRGVAKLQVRVISAPTAAEARYKRNRKYDPVPGYIGEFASLDEAQAGAATAYMVAGLPSPFPQTSAPTVVAAVNPAQVAGSAGTQSGATLETPTVLAAAAAVPAEAAQPVAIQLAATQAVIPTAKVAGFVAVAEVEEIAVKEAKPVVVVAQAAEADAAEAPIVRQRSHAERTAKRNSRSHRVAARQKKRQVVAKQRQVVVAKRERTVVQKRAVATAELREPPARKQTPGRKPVTQDGTNDMSMFSRHVHAGQERLASQEPKRRRPAYTSLAHSRDGHEG
ncbi:RlpA-like double-psi beta-barrel domain-containing protein [Hyphomicrobium sp. CS1GBMeth3]|uniref:septal ring lytic transglycosylase RlpA family protein n=1 Tax=Hyphomicrobium sp. CS1GBMeth3 TaxID=1892845 RepID=UPI0009FB658F|nr:RlpA-like double-psi beta-barrel domain-containing protein [Hyphomicrobium sp. CS1GBMeth3]